jgi:DNA-binding winged helix-turn-helix (wHTH) protein
MTKETKDRVKFGTFEVDLCTREMWKNGVKLKLGGQPFDILATLLERPGELVTRKQLRTKIWSADTFVDFNHGLNAAVNKLRECLNDSAEEPRYIETLPRLGYRFIAKLEKVREQLLASPQPPPVLGSQPNQQPQPNHPGVNLQEVITSASFWGRPYVWGALAVFFLLAVFGVWKVQEPEQQELRLKLERESISAGGAQVIQAPSIWRVDLTRPADPAARTIVTSARDRNEGPQSSPDGKKLAFMSDRSGSLEIWTSNQDGSSLAKLTNLGSCGSPRWSPDSRWIAFDTKAAGSPAIYIVPANGGQPASLVQQDDSENMVPSWSNDGRWVYFASTRTGQDQVWKVPAGGGEAVQVTRRGGFAAVESYDGRTLYYAKTRGENPEIWQIPMRGGSETMVSPLLRPGIWANWALTQKGIFFLSDDASESHLLQFFDFATRTVQPVLPLDHPSFWLSASGDGTSAWYTQGEQGVTNATLH